MAYVELRSPRRGGGGKIGITTPALPPPANDRSRSSGRPVQGHRPGELRAAKPCRVAASLNDNPAPRQSIQTLYNQGITVVVAAGNDSSLEVSQQVPATYPEVIAVASTTAVAGTSQTTLSPIAVDTASFLSGLVAEAICAGPAMPGIASELASGCDPALLRVTVTA